MSKSDTALSCFWTFLVTCFAFIMVIKFNLQPDAYIRGVKDALYNKVSYSYNYTVVGNDTLDVDTLVNCPQSY